MLKRCAVFFSITAVAMIACQANTACENLLTKVQLERENITLLQEEKIKIQEKISSFEDVTNFVTAQYENATRRCRGESVETCRDYFIELVAKPMNDNQVVKYLAGAYATSDVDKAKEQIISLLSFDVKPHVERKEEIEDKISFKSSQIDAAMNEQKCSLEN